ncbi:hypothetical protein [Fibrella arboris]|uniref:hypothetical protein n=1 Tax=Fibrella arboris TaxID=3242486 RepID=UPI003521033E
MAYPFPIQSPFSDAQLQQQFGIVTDELDPDPALHFKLMVPLNWGQVKFSRRQVTPQQPFQLRGHLTSMAGPLAEAKVYIVYTPEELSPCDWLSIYLEHQQETVLHERHTKQEGGAIPDVLSEANGLISRWLVLKDWARSGGAHLFVLQLSTAAAAYTAHLADVFVACLSHFDLLHSTGWAYAEPLRTLVRPAPIPLQTAFPISWQQLENPLGNELFYQVQLTKQLHDQRIGRIYIATVSQQAEPDMTRLPSLFNEQYHRDGIAFDSPHFKALPPFGGLQRAWYGHVAQHPAAGNVPAYEREIVVGQVGQTWFYTEQLSFTRAVSAESWAIGKRAFEIILDRLVVQR